jgi:hypothetical protein
MNRYRPKAFPGSAATRFAAINAALALLLGGSSLSSAVAAGGQSLSSQLEPLSIIVDPRREGWPDATSYAADPVGDGGAPGQVDWHILTMAHDCDDLFVRYQLADGPAFDPEGWRYNLYIDADRDIDTGYRGTGLWLPIGADVLIQGGRGKVTTFAFAGGDGQQAWAWRSVFFYPADDRAVAGGGREIEYRVPLADLDVFGSGLDSFDWVAQADYSGGAADLYPDIGSVADGEDFNTYRLEYRPLAAAGANPERGLFEATETEAGRYRPLSAKTLRCHREMEGTGLIHRYFYLEQFVETDIAEDYLAKIAADFAAIREAGVKTVLRFAYSASAPTPPYGDADKARILAHIGQLSDLLRENSDVIAVVQAGFIGLWGEWWYSDHFAPDADWAERQDVLIALLDALPESRMVQVRAPRYKQQMFAQWTPLDAGSAHDGSDLARVAHHNDCFLSSASDGGTYTGAGDEIAYLEQESAWVAMGGETCDYHFLADPAPERLSCASALDEMAALHWSFLNIDWYMPTLQAWRDAGCLDEIVRRLGYRLLLTGVTNDERARPGGEFRFDLSLRNDGFAAPFNPRGVELILRHDNGATHAFALPDDPRRWLPGGPHRIAGSVEIPQSMPPGNYELLLHLPDTEAALRERPEYAIRLANEDGWEAQTGFNRLQAFVEIAAEPSTYRPQSIRVNRGRYDWGTLASFDAIDEDTYDVEAARAGSQRIVEWTASTRIDAAPESLERITVVYDGHYSRGRVAQTVSAYNVRAGRWDVMSTRRVGNRDDVRVSFVLDEPAAYIDADGQTRVRVRGIRDRAARFYCWANALRWEVR